jgi:hypothetical protein
MPHPHALVMPFLGSGPGLAMICPEMSPCGLEAVRRGSLSPRMSSFISMAQPAPSTSHCSPSDQMCARPPCLDSHHLVSPTEGLHILQREQRVWHQCLGTSWGW